MAEKMIIGEKNTGIFYEIYFTNMKTIQERNEPQESEAKLLSIKGYKYILNKEKLDAVFGLGQT